MTGEFRIVPAGDSAMILEFPGIPGVDDRIDPEVNQRVVAVAESLQREGFAGVRDVVPTFRSVAVYFDPLRTAVNGLVEWLEAEARQPTVERREAASIVHIPVCYGGEFGPDLQEVAAFGGLEPSEAIALHASETYRVYMLGFLPGFAYLATVNPRIAAPRLATPRVRVPSGSVAIAGQQTGIYPSETPGGWLLIGRTPLKPYDAVRTDPFLLKAGDRVKFDPIDLIEYKAWPRSA